MKTRPSRYLTTILILLLAVGAAACGTIPATELVTEPALTPLPTTPTSPAETIHPVAQLAVEALAAQTGFPADSIVIQSIEEVDWPNGCLGIDYKDTACTDAIVPGFRIILQANGQTYEYRSNLDGSLLLAATPFTLSISDPIGLMARKALATQLQIPEGDITLISVEEKDWPDGCLGIQTPGQVCMTVIVPGFQIILQANGMSYEYRSNQNGSVLLFAGEVPGSQSTVVLLYQVDGGIAGFCDDLTVFADGFVQFNSCNAVTPSKTSQLTQPQLAQLQTWVRDYATFEHLQADPAVADQMTVTLNFTGTGTQTAADDVRQQIMTFAADLLASVRGISPVESEPLIGGATPTPEGIATLAGLIYTTGNGLWQIGPDGTPIQLFATQEARLSPDGQQLLSSDGNDLFLTTLASGEIRNLTNTPNRIEILPQSGNFFVDKIFFASFSDTTEGAPGFTGYLTVINPDGSGYRVLDEENNAGMFAVAPDEHTVAYGDGQTTWLYHLDTDTRESFNPADYSVNDAALLGSPSWSPNGDMLAWMVSGNFGGQDFALGVFDLKGKIGAIFHPHQLFGLGGFPPGGVWSPDGSYVALNTFNMENVQPDTWVVPVVPLFNKRPEFHVGGSNPIWSPDGSHLVVVNNEDGNLLLVNTSTWETTSIQPPDKIFNLLDW